MIRKKFEIKIVDGQKVIFIDEELFDWGLDEGALERANEFSSNLQTMEAIHLDIKNYFLECLSEQLGFKPTIKQINKALQDGYIENDNN